jgi:hypothetical protein
MWRQQFFFFNANYTHQSEPDECCRWYLQLHDNGRIEHGQYRSQHDGNFERTVVQPSE